MGYINQIFQSLGIQNSGSLGQGSTAITVLLLVFFGPVLLGPLRYILSALTQSAALLTGNLISFATNIGVSILQIGNAGVVGVRPMAYRARSLLGAAIILLCGMMLGMVISMYDIPQYFNKVGQHPGVIEFSTSSPEQAKEVAFDTF